MNAEPQAVAMESVAYDKQISEIAEHADKLRAATPSKTIGNVTIYSEMVQGSEEWSAARCGLLTASEMKLIVTPTLKAASNDKERGHLYELLAQRITRYVEPRYVTDDMLRGQNDEVDALELYAKQYEPIQRVGFITNDKFGFTIGYSPDALVGDDGQVECKSRSQKLQIRTLTEYVFANEIDPDFMIQVQTGLMVSERAWCDLVSYCGGLPMATVRVFPNQEIQDAILAAATSFEARLLEKQRKFDALMAGSKARLIPTERKIIQEMYDGHDADYSTQI